MYFPNHRIQTGSRAFIVLPALRGRPFQVDHHASVPVYACGAGVRIRSFPLSPGIYDAVCIIDSMEIPIHPKKPDTSVFFLHFHPGRRQIALFTAVFIQVQDDFPGDRGPQRKIRMPSAVLRSQHALIGKAIDKFIRLIKPCEVYGTYGFFPSYTVCRRSNLFNTHSICQLNPAAVLTAEEPAVQAYFPFPLPGFPIHIGDRIAKVTLRLNTNGSFIFIVSSAHPSLTVHTLYASQNPLLLSMNNSVTVCY